MTTCGSVWLALNDAVALDPLTPERRVTLMGMEYLPEPLPPPKGWKRKPKQPKEQKRNDGMGWEYFRWASLLWFLK
jgi:hypothetical protein